MLQSVEAEDVMPATFTESMFDEADGDLSARRRAEAAWILDAIVGAIVTGKLPPDDACAWAKIAAYEIEQLGATPSLPLAA
jgi:hypothetical protein